MRRFWKKYHKWVGLCLTFFVLMFCLSGIVLNHRQLFSSCDVSRSWLPQSYHYDNWNNGIVKGTLRLSPSQILLWGNAGLWVTDNQASQVMPLNDGLPEGADNRKVSNVVRTADGKLWCAALYGIYRLEGNHWTAANIDLDGERVSDIALRGDTMAVVSRSFVFTSQSPYTSFTRHELKTPKDYDPKVSLFKTVWQLHSGELFGLVGRLVVDAMAVVIICLCITGIVYFFAPGIMKRRKRKQLDNRKIAKTLKFSVLWHNRLGRWTIILTLLLAFTGACLRPPLMIPLAITKTNPVPLSTMSSSNAWHDKLRAVRWDEASNVWLLSTSSGFYQLSDFAAVPISMKGAPMISPMGINVFEPCGDGQWLVGSFSGLFRWNPGKGELTDYFTGRKPEVGGMRQFAGGTAVSGFSHDLKGREIVFEYGKGATAKTDDATTGASQQASSGNDRTETGRQAEEKNTAHSPLPQMPELLASQPMSLWNFALELHVGRCYSPLIGPFSSLFVFLSGTLLFLLLLSGWIVLRRTKKQVHNKL